MRLKKKKITNNFIKHKKKYVEKSYSQNDRMKREKYFYSKFENKKLQIPEVISILKNKIILKKYKFKKINSEKFFLDSLLNFIIETNKEKNYKYKAKEYLISYKHLYNQVENRFKKIDKIVIEDKYLD